jgi:hypothetical protein
VSLSSPLDYLVLAPLAFQLAMLTLQARAFSRHRHMSFLLLSIATICAIIVLAIPFAFRYLFPRAFLSAEWSLVLTLALVFQVVLGLWGTASLFRSYAQLASELRTRGGGVRSA